MVNIKRMVRGRRSLGVDDRRPLDNLCSRNGLLLAACDHFKTRHDSRSLTWPFYYQYSTFAYFLVLTKRFVYCLSGF